jgi:hypothetical protein
MAKDRDKRDDADDDGEWLDVSTDPKNAIDPGGIGFGPGPAKILEARFKIFDYQPKEGSKKRVVRAPVLLVKYERDGEQGREPYSLGQGPWRILKKGCSIQGKKKAGLPKGCNALYLIESLIEQGMPPGTTDNVNELDGAEVVLIQKPIERDFGEDKGGIKKQSILVVKEVVSAPWMDEGAPSGKGKGKGRPADDDEDDDEKPAEKRRTSKDDDEDEKPRRASKRNDKQTDADIDEEAVEALLDVLEAGPVRVKDLEEKVRAKLKGNAQRHVIAARAVEDDLLEQEKGWTWDQKKGRVELEGA